MLKLIERKKAYGSVFSIYYKDNNKKYYLVPSINGYILESGIQFSEDEDEIYDMMAKYIDEVFIIEQTRNIDYY